MNLALGTGAFGEPDPNGDLAIMVRLAARDLNRLVNRMMRKPEKPMMVPAVDHGGERHQRIGHGGWLETGGCGTGNPRR